MRNPTMFLLYTFLYSLCCDGRLSSDQCDYDSDCDPRLTCIRNRCTMCTREGTTCSETDAWACCEGTVCHKIPGTDKSMCLRGDFNRCLTNTDCSHDLKCVLRLGQCGVCKSDGEICSLPLVPPAQRQTLAQSLALGKAQSLEDHKSLECCSSYCRLIDNMVGKCTSLFQPCLPIVLRKLDLKHKKNNDDIVPIINPFFGIWDGDTKNRGHIFD
jgi:hypothetical protein